MDYKMKKPTLLTRAYEARRKAIHLQRKRGWTLQRIGDRWGITRERVRQILKFD